MGATHEPKTIVDKYFSGATWKKTAYAKCFPVRTQNVTLTKEKKWGDIYFN